jgi:hypothetical protein
MGEKFLMDKFLSDRRKLVEFSENGATCLGFDDFCFCVFCLVVVVGFFVHANF